MRRIALLIAVLWLAGDISAQIPVVDGNKFAGLKWTFVRIKYGTYEDEGASRLAYWDEPWAIDAPAAEQNLSRRIKSVTAIEVGDPIVITLEDPKLWENPWIYIVEPSNLVLKDIEVTNLRQFLLRGGTLMFDDFHGPYEWELFERQMKRVFPGREAIELPLSHDIFHCVYDLKEKPQIPSIHAWWSGRTSERGADSATPHYMGIFDDKGRMMVIICHNTDVGDG